LHDFFQNAFITALNHQGFIFLVSHSKKGENNMRKLALILALVSLTACAAQTSNTLFTPGQPITKGEGKGALLFSMETKINPGALVPGQSSRIELPLPEKTIQLILKPVSDESLALPEGQHAWVANTHNAFFMRIGEMIEGRLQLGDKYYRLRSKTPEIGVLDVFDARRFREPPNDDVRIAPKAVGQSDVSGDSSCEDAADRVDVMVLYTPAARDGAGGVAQIQNEIAFDVGYNNLALANSSAAHRLNLIHTDVVSYTEPAGGVDSNALLGDLADTSDGVMDPIHSVRDSVRADLVSLIFEKDNSTDNWCGWGHAMDTANADTTDHAAFTVVRRECAGTNLSFAHEVGHNMGARHDRANTNPADSDHDYNFGHIQPTPSTAGVDPWRTVMAYGSPCSDSSATGRCQRVPWFSNPNVSRSGDATGVALTETEPEHNVAVFALNDGAVSRYRCLHGGAAANVWMKDRWEDTGGEPDANTIGKAMWQSPYIWVRLSEDATFEHAHEHQDPQQAHTNHVYVKLHNSGGVNESSDLELYFASASTSLNNPTNWTLIDTQALTISPGVEVAHFEWTDPPGSGHYCLLARWNIDATPLSFTDVGDAVRADNDLIWRNVNVVGLGGSPDSSADFEMAGDRISPETYLLITTRPMSHRKIDWHSIAMASLKVNPAALNMENLEIVGLKPIEAGLYRFPLDKTPKLIGPFNLQPGRRTRAGIAFKTDPAEVKKARAKLSNAAHYEVSVIQIRADAVDVALSKPSALFEKAGYVIGGVSYTLQLPPAR
jgi:hypothetical protein